MLKVLVIIPAYNEEKNIVEVIRDVKKHCARADILVINDSSCDETSSWARQETVTVLDMPFNLGIGGIVQTGYLYAREFGYDIAVQFDADGQHKAQELPDLLNTMNSAKNPDMIIASRFLMPRGYKASFLRKIGIRYFSALIFLLTGEKITDPTSGFRMVNRKLIELFSDNYAQDYPEPESIVLALKKGFFIAEIPTSMQARNTGKSSITPLKAVYYMIKVTISILTISPPSPYSSPF